MKNQLFTVLLFFQISSALKILKTPKFPDGKTPPSSFATFRGAKLFARLWVSPTHKHHAEVLSRNEDSGLLLTFKSDGNYIAIDSYYIRFDFSSDFVPSKWMFFCFTFDNSENKIKIYEGSKLILEKQISKEIPEDFLQNLQLGKASKFAGELTQLNIWSQVLTDDDIKILGDCKEVSIFLIF